MLGAGHDDATLASVLMDPSFAMSAKVLSQKNARNPRYLDQTKAWVAKEIARAKAKHLHAQRNGDAPGPPAKDPPLPYSDYTNALAFVGDHGPPCGTAIPGMPGWCGPVPTGSAIPAER